MSEKSSKFARKFVKWGVGILQTTTTMNNENQNIEYKESWRAEYGQQIVSHVATQLQQEYETKSFELRNIQRMMQFAQTFPDFQIVAPLARKLSWSHFLVVMPIKDELQREFYLTMAANEMWSVRTLQAKIDDLDYYCVRKEARNR